MSKSGQKQSQTKGRSNLPPLDTGSQSNLIMFCRLQIGYVWTEVIRKKKLRFKNTSGWRPWYQERLVLKFPIV